MKISTIKFVNYRAFYDGTNNEYLLNISDKNLLIYGENGSGKTSFYRGLMDFVNQEDFIIHNQAQDGSEGFVEVGFDDGSSERIDETVREYTNIKVLNAKKLNSFLSYKELLRTYLYKDETKEINLFDLVVNTILKNHKLSTLGNLKEAWDAANIDTTAAQISFWSDLLDKNAIDTDGYKEKIEIVDALNKRKYEDFEEELEELLQNINVELKNIIKYFNQSIDLELILTAGDPNNNKYPVITSKVNFFNKALPNYHANLNEARLSALSLSIYFAAIKSNPTEEALKVLVLDDIFIGLDMGNRMPLLDILKNEFSDWQIFITTYDRNWFEVAKRLTSNWLHIEMYAGKKEDNNFEHPVILLESDSHYDKAKKYLLAKDYPASANYLRKEIEKLIKERLSEEKIRDYGEKPKLLSNLWKMFIERYIENGHPISKEIITLFESSRITLLNPQSHDNINAPIYGYELNKAFELVDLIKDVPILDGILVMEKGMEFTFRHPNVDYTFTFELITDWMLNIHNGVVIEIRPKCKIKHWNYNGVSFWNFKKSVPYEKTDLAPILEKKDISLDYISDVITNKIKIFTTSRVVFEKNTSYENWITLDELFRKIEKTKLIDKSFMVIFWTKVKNFFDN